GASVNAGLRPVVEEAWRLLPEPAPLPETVEGESLNWFVTSDRFLRTRRQRLESVITALEVIAAGRALDVKVVSRRYTEGLPGVTREDRDALAEHLRRFVTEDLQ